MIGSLSDESGLSEWSGTVKVERGGDHWWDCTTYTAVVGESEKGSPANL